MKSKKMMWFKLLVSCSALFYLMFTSGCAKPISPTVATVEQGGVQGAAVFCGTQYPKTVPVILNVSNYIINAANGGQVVTIAQINAQVLREEAAIPSLTLAEKNAINAFLVAMQPLIAMELASNHLNINQDITNELCWVAQWASNILGGPGTCKIPPPALVSAPTTS